MKRVLLVLATILSSTTFAQDAVSGVTDKGYLGIAAALAIGLAAFGGSLGQGKAAASALEGISRNPSASKEIFTPMIIALALIESLVIYALVIAFLIKP
jgi:F-type H+-transporting ATPase subunit c